MSTDREKVDAEARGLARKLFGRGGSTDWQDMQIERALAAAREEGRKEEREAIAQTLRLDDMDRAGGDGYGMPECPWCGAQGERDGDAKWHEADCVLAAIRARNTEGT